MTPQPSQKGCCEKCWDTQDGTGIRFCSNPQCECHQKQCSRCLKTISTEDGTTHTCKLATGETPAGDWEKEFDEKFIDEGMLYQAAGEDRYVSAGFTVKRYIRSLLTRVDEEARKDAWNTMVNIESVPDEIIKQLRKQGRDAALAEAMKEVKNANTMLVSSFEQPYTGTENSAFNDGLRMGVHALDRIAAALSALRDSK